MRKGTFPSKAEGKRPLLRLFFVVRVAAVHLLKTLSFLAVLPLILLTYYSILLVDQEPVSK
jgi:hypothetical protein